MIEVAGVLLIQGEDYVMQHRDDKPTIAEPGMYSLWGGTMENGETPEEGALRELKEETGLVLDEANIKFLAQFETEGIGPKSFGRKVRVHLFVSYINDSTEINCNEGQGIYRHKKYSELSSNMNDFAKTAIEIYETASR